MRRLDRDGASTWVAGVVAAFAGVLGLTVAAGKLLATVESPDGSTRVDSAITSWTVAHRTDSATTLAKLLSAIGSQKALIPAVILVALLLARRRRFAWGGFLLVAWGGAVGLYTLGKYFVGRPRPPQDLWLVRVVGKSFPSGHAAQSMATFLALAVVASAFEARARRPGLAAALVLTAGVGWSRVYLGVHWSTDVAAGWVMAAAWIGVLYWLERRRNGSSEPDPPG